MEEKRVEDVIKRMKKDYDSVDIGDSVIRSFEWGIKEAEEGIEQIERWKEERGSEVSDSCFSACTYGFKDVVIKYFAAEAVAKSGIIPQERFEKAKKRFKEIIQYEIGRIESRAIAFGHGDEYREACIRFQKDAKIIEIMHQYFAE